MRKFMRRSTIALALAAAGGLFLSFPPMASAQRRRVIIVERPVFVEPDPFFAYPYPYPYPYVAANYGEVKIDTHRKGLAVYIDGGYAGTTPKAKKFALQPGTHEISLRNSDGQTIYRERVAVLIGHTTKLRVG
jgi:hypothetical protein